METKIVNVRSGIGYRLAEDSTYFAIQDETVRKAINGQIAGYITGTLLGNNSLTNLPGDHPITAGSPVASYAPLQFNVHAMSGRLSRAQTIVGCNDVLGALETLGGENLRVGGDGVPAFQIEYRIVDEELVCLQTLALEIAEGDGFTRASFTAVVGQMEVPVDFHISLGWAVPLT